MIEIFALLFLLAVFAFMASVVIRMLPGLRGMATEPPRLPARFGWAALTAVIGLNIFLYDANGPGIGLALFSASVIIAELLCFPAARRDTIVWLIGGIGIASSLLIGGRSNGFVMSMNAVAAAVCMATLALLFVTEKRQWNILWVLKITIAAFVSVCSRPLQLGSGLRERARANSTGTVIRTTLLTLVVVLFFTYILSAADPVFDRIVSDVREQALGRTVLSAVLLAVLGAVLSQRIAPALAERVPEFRVLRFVEVFVPAVALAALFALFLFIQARYLFGTQADFQALDITYSDYVRKGFVELLTASAFGVVLAYALALKGQVLQGRESQLLRWTNGVLLVELLLLLVSAGKRDFLYVETYGLTRVRIIGFVFLLWLAGIIALLFALDALRKARENHVLLGTVLLSTAALAMLNAVNIDAVVAESTPPRGQPRDLFYIANLTPDAAASWEGVVRQAEAEYEALRVKTVFTEAEQKRLADIHLALRAITNQRVTLRIGDASESQRMGWRDGTLSDRKATEILRREDPSVVTMMECVLDGIQMLRGIDLFALQSNRIREYEYPFVSTKAEPQGMNPDGTQAGVFTEPPSCRPASTLRQG